RRRSRTHPDARIGIVGRPAEPTTRRPRRHGNPHRAGHVVDRGVPGYSEDVARPRLSSYRNTSGVRTLGMTANRLRTRVQGRTVLITGASSGIGASCARQLAEAGATVLLVARSADRLQELATEIQQRGGTAS